MSVLGLSKALRRTLYPFKSAVVFLVVVGAGVGGIANTTLSAESPIALAAAKGCMACHDINSRGLGPAFKDIAKRYSTEDREMLADHILNGSSGSWGGVPMPANSKLGVTKYDAQQLADWILNLL